MQYLVDTVKWTYHKGMIPFGGALRAAVKWSYESGVTQLIQALLVFAGLFFTGYQLVQARRSFQATVVSQVSERSFRLQWEVMKDPELQPLLGFSNATAEEKRALAIGLIVNHFALIYDLWRLGGIPDEVWGTFESELRDMVSNPDFVNRWTQLKQGHRPDFIDLVDSLRAQRQREVEHGKPEIQEKGGKSDE